MGKRNGGAGPGGGGAGSPASAGGGVVDQVLQELVQVEQLGQLQDPTPLQPRALPALRGKSVSIINTRVSIAANATNSDVLSGEMFRRLRKDSAVRMGIVGSATGLEATVHLGDKAMTNNYKVGVEAAANAGVDVARDLKLIEVGLANDEILVSVTNTTAGALDVEVYGIIS